MIVSPAYSLQLPFPRIGLSTSTLFSLINPPNTFLFGGSFEGTLQQDVYLLRYKNNLASPLLTINCFKTRGLAPSPRSHALLTSYKSHLIFRGSQTSPTTPVNNNRLYQLSSITHSWINFASSGACPSGLVGSAGTVYQENLHVFAGKDAAGLVNSNLWRANLDNRQ